MATDHDPAMRHLEEASELANTGTANVLGESGQVGVCELGILHALIAIELTLREIAARFPHA